MTDDEPVWVEFSWEHVKDLADVINAKDGAEVSEFAGSIGSFYDFTPEEYDDRIATNEFGEWVKMYISYHGNEYDGFGDGRDERLTRDEAERRGADPCPACYPDDPRNEWAQVSQAEGPEGGVTTMIEPKATEGSDDEGPLGADYDPKPPDPREYHESARAMYEGYLPETPEAGPVRSESEFHDYLRELGATVRIDPSGVVHYGADVPDEIKQMQIALARELDEPLYEQFGFKAPPAPPEPGESENE